MAIWGDDKKNKEMTDAIVAGISATIADSVSKTMQPVFEGLAGEIKAALSESKAQQDKAAADMAESIRGMQQLMQEISANIATMQKLAEGQQQVLEKLAEVQSRQAATQQSLTQECETAFSGVRDTQNKLSALYDSIGNGATALVAREEGVVKNQKKLLDTAAEDLISLQTKWTENFNKANGELTANYDKMFKQMEAATSALAAYTDNLKKADAGMNAGVADLKNEIAGAMKELSTGVTAEIGGLKTEITGAVNELNTGINAGFSGFTSNMEKSISETFKTIDKELGEAAAIMGKATEEVAQAAQKLPKAVRGLA